MLFSKVDVNKVEWLNLVFENRNQSYGAYELRRESGSYLLKSLLLTGFLFGAVVLFLTLNSKTSLEDPLVSVAPLVTPDEVHVLPVEVLKPKPELAKPKSSQASAPTLQTEVQQVKFAGKLNPVRDHVSIAEVPTIKLIEESVIGLENREGLKAAGVSNGANLEGDGTGLATEGSSTGTEIYPAGFLEEMPEFPGGMKAWADFLTKNLFYPLNARENGISGKVVVSFVVEKNGEISNLKVIRGIGGGCDEEAMRVIKKSPFWKPGMQNGRAVRVAYTMPVVFRME